jgi:hypothetical protein
MIAVRPRSSLITMGASSFFPAEMSITHLVDPTRKSAAFYAPGPIVEMTVSRPTHPVFYGYTEHTMPV